MEQTLRKLISGSTDLKVVSRRRQRPLTLRQEKRVELLSHLDSAFRARSFRDFLVHLEGNGSRFYMARDEPGVMTNDETVRIHLRSADRLEGFLRALSGWDKLPFGRWGLSREDARLLRLRAAWIMASDHRLDIDPEVMAKAKLLVRWFDPVKLEDLARAVVRASPAEPFPAFLACCETIISRREFW